MAAFLIAATGTDCGKTLLTAGLLWQAHGAGMAVSAIKPVASGVREDALAHSDSGQLLAAMGREVSAATAAVISPWRYAAPVSPHLAGAGDAGLTAPAILAFCRDAMRAEGVLLIEGAGGVMTPLAQGFTQAELAQRLDVPVVLVTGCHLGTISHTLTAAEALAARGIALHAIVVNDAPGGTEPPQDIRASIAAHLPVATPVFTLPRISPTTEQAWKQLPPVMEIIVHA